MKITPVCGNAFYSIRFVEFIKSDGHRVESYFELIYNPFKCVGIFTSVDAAKEEMKRLTELHCQRAGEESLAWREVSGQRA